jgi:hypothetical protein
MKKSRPSQPIASFSKAAFRVGAESLAGQRLGLLLDETLAIVFGGGDADPDQGGCSEFSCNLYSPPPPDNQVIKSPTSTTTEKKVPQPTAPA